MKSLNRFPSKQSAFDADRYGIDVRTQVGAASPYTGEIGLELELEGVGLPDRYRGRSVGGSTWNYHADGSLRAVGGRGAGGAEYVLDQPCARADVRPLLVNLFAYLDSVGARIQNSTRCSTHVHLNMRGAKINQIASFVTLWGTFEDALANWCGPHRSGNHFALRLSDCSPAVSKWVEAFQTGVFEFNRERRYLALNPACLGTFGSLEIRTLAGVESPDDVVTWVDWLTRLKDVAFGLEYENPQALAATFSGDGPREFARRMLGDAAVEQLIEACAAVGEDFDQLVRDGFRRVQPIVYALPWDAVLPAIKRPYVPDPFGRRLKRPAPIRLRRADMEEDADFGPEPN